MLNTNENCENCRCDTAWRKIKNIQDRNITYQCDLCKKTIDVLEENKCYALVKWFDGLSLEVIDKTNIEQVNNSKEIFEFLSPELAEDWLKENYPNQGDLIRHSTSFNSNGFPAWRIDKNPKYEGRNLDELEDYAIKYGKIYLYDMRGIVNNPSHSIEKVSGPFTQFYVIDGLFIIEDNMFYYDPNARLKVKKKVEKETKKRQKNIAFPAYALDNLFYTITRFWVSRFSDKLQISVMRRKRIKKEEKIDIIFKMDKELKGFKFDKTDLEPFNMFMPTMLDYKGKKEEETFIEKLPEFKKFLKRKMKLAK